MLPIYTCLHSISCFSSATSCFSLFRLFVLIYKSSLIWLDFCSSKPFSCLIFCSSNSFRLFSACRSAFLSSFLLFRSSVARSPYSTSDCTWLISSSRFETTSLKSWSWWLLVSEKSQLMHTGYTSASVLLSRRLTWQLAQIESAHIRQWWRFYMSEKVTGHVWQPSLSLNSLLRTIWNSMGRFSKFSHYHHKAN